MYKLLGDYHSHTIYSSGFKKRGTHAKGTIEENAKAAHMLGLECLVISEHGPGHYLYGIKEENLPEMREEIKRLNEIYQPKGLKILLGIEANIIGLDGTLDVSQDFIDQLDILLMGYHYGATPVGLKDAYKLYWTTQISKLFDGKSQYAMDIMTDVYIKSMDKYPINIITHPGSKAKVHIEEVAKKALVNNVALEISSKHDELSIESLEKIKDIPVSLYINSDAHDPSRIGDVDKGVSKAIDSGIDLSRIVNIKWEVE